MSVVRGTVRRIRLLLHRCHKAKPIAPQRLDIAVVPSAAAQGPPRRGEGAFQRRVADALAVPDLLAQLLLADHALALGE
jgi:hypothetical protein